MSHELRTPLNAILGLSESLQDGVFGAMDERQQKSIGIIERSGRHLLDLINDILELSKIEAGKLELVISTVSISQLCKSSLSFVKQQAFKKQIQLHISMAENLGDIAVDERRIRQVLINLLTNAVKFTSSGGQVTLEVHREPKEINLMERVPLSHPMMLSQFPLEVDHCSLENSHSLCISVIDTGIGIAPVHQAKLFQPFVQVDSSLNRQYEGTGLGLALVKQIVELHGGDVSLQSSPGQGSCFTVRLPYRCQREPNPALSESFDISQISGEPTILEPVAALYGNNLPLILLAEDNEVNVSTISSYLEAKGYRVLVAKNGQEAIDFTKAHHPNLILMDIQMPGVDGLEAIQTIRKDKQFAQIPIIALTALAMAGDRDKCLESGASYYLTKPVKLKQLVTTMRQLLS
jgi:CheY-like chemotaxis protein